MCQFDPTRTRRRAATASLALAAALVACGGGDPPASARADGAAAAAVAPAPLFDAQGHARPTPRALQPAATAARTRTGLYATREQLAREELTAGPSTILIDVDANGSADNAVRLAEQVRFWRGTQGLAFYVRGRDAAAVAEVVNRLSDAGFGTVFAVV